MHFQLKEKLPLTAEQAFDFVVIHQPENHPKWEPEVLEARREGPAARGARGTMLRKDGSRVKEVPFQIVDFVAGRHVEYLSGAGGFTLHLKFDFEPAPHGCVLTVDSRAELSGPLMLLTPIFALVFPKRSARISGSMVRVLKEHAASA